MRNLPAVMLISAFLEIAEGNALHARKHGEFGRKNAVANILAF